MAKEVQLIKFAIDHLLGAELLSENGWSTEDIETLKKLNESDFDIVIKNHE